MNFPVELPSPYLQKAKEMDIHPEDIDEKFVRGSGKGGQKINKTSSCVMLKHGPTGIEVRCQKHREQSKNRLSAYKILILKIEDRVKGKASQHAQKIFKLAKQKKRRSRRSQEKMLQAKKARSAIKADRTSVPEVS